MDSKHEDIPREQSKVEARTCLVEAIARHGDRREPLDVCVHEWAILDYLACPTIHLRLLQLRISKVIREAIRLVMPSGG